MNLTGVSALLLVPANLYICTPIYLTTQISVYLQKYFKIGSEKCLDSVLKEKKKKLYLREELSITKANK